MLMIEILVFTLTAAFLYLFSDWLLRFIELQRGAPLKNRSVVFFAIILVLALVSFELLPVLIKKFT